MSHTTPPHSLSPHYDDEIDLWELWQTLYDAKWLILGLTTVVVALSAMITFSLAKTHTAQAIVLPPASETVSPLNYFLTQTQAQTEEEEGNKSNSNNIYSSTKIFTAFLVQLQADRNILPVIERYNLLPNVSVRSDDSRTLQDIQIETFKEGLQITAPSKKAITDEYTIMLSLKEVPATTLNEALNDLIRRAEASSKHQITRAANQLKTLQLKRLNQNIAALRDVHQRKRLDRLAELDEAIVIAKGAGYQQPENGLLTDRLPLYYLGYALLEQERKVLAQRESDDPFIPELRDIEQRIYVLDHLSLKESNFQVLRFEKPAITNADKTKPKTLLILSVSAVLGLMLAVFVVLIRSAIRARREKPADVAPLT